MNPFSRNPDSLPPAPSRPWSEINRLLRESAYLPGAGSDWMELVCPLAALGCELLVIADYGLTHMEFSENVELLNRQGIVRTHHYRAHMPDLLPVKWAPPEKMPQREFMEGILRRSSGGGAFPFYEWLWLRTPQAKGDRPEVQVVYLSDEAYWTFHGVYVLRGIRPKGIVLPRKPMGERSWFDFQDPDGIFAQAVRSNPAGTPDFVVQSGSQPYWTDYNRPEDLPEIAGNGDWRLFERR